MQGEWNYVIAAYAITWVVFVAYALRLERVTRRVRARRDEAARGVGGTHGGV
ncbi:MAG TPA: hypothetical protein VNL96_06000 [Gemmatimonadaceae bacterium]|nr:hypothetical protein [Gemmatimonadaceae bacterium]